MRSNFLNFIKTYIELSYIQNFVKLYQKHSTEKLSRLNIDFLTVIEERFFLEFFNVYKQLMVCKIYEYINQEFINNRLYFGSSVSKTEDRNKHNSAKEMLQNVNSVLNELSQKEFSDSTEILEKFKEFITSANYKKSLLKFKVNTEELNRFYLNYLKTFAVDEIDNLNLAKDFINDMIMDGLGSALEKESWFLFHGVRLEVCGNNRRYSTKY